MSLVIKLYGTMRKSGDLFKIILESVRTQPQKRN